MFHVLNSLKNIEVGHFTRRPKLPHSTCVFRIFDSALNCFESFEQSCEDDRQLFLEGLRDAIDWMCRDARIGLTSPHPIITNVITELIQDILCRFPQFSLVFRE